MSSSTLNRLVPNWSMYVTASSRCPKNKTYSAASVETVHTSASSNIESWKAGSSSVWPGRVPVAAMESCAQSSAAVADASFSSYSSIRAR
jgi:hypothetical protein